MYHVIVDEGAKKKQLEIESEKSYCFSINLLVIQNFHLNPLLGHFENTKKRPQANAATLLTIYHRLV